LSLAAFLGTAVLAEIATAGLAGTAVVASFTLAAVASRVVAALVATAGLGIARAIPTVLLNLAGFGREDVQLRRGVGRRGCFNFLHVCLGLAGCFGRDRLDGTFGLYRCHMRGRNLLGRVGCDVLSNNRGPGISMLGDLGFAGLGLVAETTEGLALGLDDLNRGRDVGFGWLVACHGSRGRGLAFAARQSGAFNGSEAKRCRRGRDSWRGGRSCVRSCLARLGSRVLVVH
jgi:hypothetical protein